MTDARSRKSAVARPLLWLAAALLGVALTFVVASGAIGERKVSIGFGEDSITGSGSCTVIVSGSSFTGRGLPEEAAVLPAGGEITKTLLPGSYSANAYCQDSAESRIEGEASFVVVATDTEVTIDLR